MSQYFSGSDLKRLRLSAGMSQKDLADGVVSAGFLSLIESGQRRASVQVLDRLLGKLGIDRNRDLQLRECLMRARTALALAQFADVDTELRRAEELDETSPITGLISALRDEILNEPFVAQAALTDLIPRLATGSLERFVAVLGLCRCANETGRSDIAVEYGIQALNEAPDSSVDVDTFIELRGTLAYLLSARGEHARAISVVRSSGSTFRDSKWALATQKWVESSTHRLQGEHELALMCAREALTAIQEVNRPLSRARLQIVAANAEVRIGDFEAARVLQLVNEAEPVFVELAQREDVALCQFLRARLEAHEHGMPAALAQMRKAIATLPAAARILRARTLTTLGELCVADGLVEDAVGALQEATKELDECQMNSLSAHAWHDLGQCYEALGRLPEALACLKRAAEASGLGKALNNAAIFPTVPMSSLSKS